MWILAFLLVFGLGNARTAFSQRSPVFNILDYGAKADGKTVNTVAINQALQACAKAGGGTVYVPPGEFLTGTIVLRSNVTLHLEAGAVLKGSPDLADYKVEAEDGSGVDPEFDKFFGRRYGLIWANKAENIAITGHGVIDGNGTHFMDLSKRRIEDDFDGRFTRQGKSYMYGDKEMGDGPVLPKDRPSMLFRCIECKHLLVRDVLIKDSPEWTMHIANSDQIDIIGVTIRNPPLYANNDGIHCTSSRNIHIANCDISAGDDAIVVTGFGPPGIAENVTVANCALQSRSSAIRIGYGRNNIRNGVFQNLVIYGSNRGIGLFTRDGGSIENFLFSNVIIETRLHTGHWWGHGEPIHVSAVPAMENTKPGSIKNVRFSNIAAHSESGIVVYGVKEQPIQNLSLERINLTVLPSSLSAAYGGNFDLRPVWDKALAIFKHDVPGVYCRYANEITIRDLELRWAQPPADYLSHGIECEYFEDLVIDGFRGRQASPAGNAAAIALDRGKKATIRNSEAAEGTGVFLLHSDVTDERLFVNNDLSRAKKAFHPDKGSFQSYGNAFPPE